MAGSACFPRFISFDWANFQAEHDRFECISKRMLPDSSPSGNGRPPARGAGGFPRRRDSARPARGGGGAPVRASGKAASFDLGCGQVHRPNPGGQRKRGRLRRHEGCARGHAAVAVRPGAGCGRGAEAGALEQGRREGPAGAGGPPGPGQASPGGPGRKPVRYPGARCPARRRRAGAGGFGGSGRPWGPERVWRSKVRGAGDLRHGGWRARARGVGPGRRLSSRRLRRGIGGRRSGRSNHRGGLAVQGRRPGRRAGGLSARMEGGAPCAGCPAPPPSRPRYSTVV